MLLSFISLGIVTLTTIILSRYLFVLNKKYKELQVKLKITTDFADTLSKRVLEQSKASSKRQAKKPYKKTRRSPKRSNNSNQSDNK
jgi:hypothetical protein